MCCPHQEPVCGPAEAAGRAPAPEVVPGVHLGPALRRGRDEGAAVHVQDLLARADQPRREPEHGGAPLHARVVGVAGVVDEGEGGVDGHAHLGDLVVWPGGGAGLELRHLVGVVEDHAHEVVQQPGQEHLLGGQAACSRLGGCTRAKVARHLEDAEEEHGRQALLHQQRRRPVGLGVVGDEVVHGHDVLGFVEVVLRRAEALVVCPHPPPQPPPLRQRFAADNPECEEPGLAAAAVEDGVLEAALVAVVRGQRGPATRGRAELGEGAAGTREAVGQPPQTVGAVGADILPVWRQY